MNEHNCAKRDTPVPSLASVVAPFRHADGSQNLLSWVGDNWNYPAGRTDAIEIAKVAIDRAARGLCPWGCRPGECLCLSVEYLPRTTKLSSRERAKAARRKRKGQAP
jgi:hypothetical protein